MLDLGFLCVKYVWSWLWCENRKRIYIDNFHRCGRNYHYTFCHLIDPEVSHNRNLRQGQECETLMITEVRSHSITANNENGCIP